MGDQAQGEVNSLGFFMPVTQASNEILGISTLT